MGKPKKTIKKSIFFSHIAIIVISMILTLIVFNLCLRLYVRTQTKAQLRTAGVLIQKSMTQKIKNLIDVQEFGKDAEITKNLLNINKSLKQIQLISDINYALIGANGNMVYPSKESSEEYNLLQKRLLPLIGKKKWLAAEEGKSSVFYFTAQNKSYAAIIYPIKLSNSNKIGYLLVYSDLAKGKNIMKVVNIMLFFILLIAAFISLIISSKVSEKISHPISELTAYAKKIGEREYHIKPVKYEDEEIGQLSDTMAAMAQKLSAYDNTMKTFMQNASHELRTPLMSIQGYAEGIKYGVLDDQDKAVDIIIEESKRLSGLVEDLLYLSKLDAMQENLNIEKVNVEDLIRGSVERVNGIAVFNEKIIRISPIGKDLTILGDEEKLIRAIINILGNCLRYCKKYIDIKFTDDDKNLSITIEDDGPGFEEKDLANIFQRFFKGRGGNYGLGLTISKSIIEKHGGVITARNSGKGGACFNISLPKTII